MVFLALSAPEPETSPALLLNEIVPERIMYEPIAPLVEYGCVLDRSARERLDLFAEASAAGYEIGAIRSQTFELLGRIKRFLQIGAAAQRNIMPKPYDPEFKDRALRMLAEALPERGSVHAASKHIGGLLGVSPDTLRVWYRQTHIDAGDKPGVTTDMAAENRRLQREVEELRKANEVLKAASIFFAKELDHPRTK